MLKIYVKGGKVKCRGKKMPFINFEMKKSLEILKKSLKIKKKCLRILDKAT